MLHVINEAHVCDLDYRDSLLLNISCVDSVAKRNSKNDFDTTFNSTQWIKDNIIIFVFIT